MSHDVVRLDFLTNAVVVDGAQLAFSDRQGELLVLLCLCGGYADASALAGALWPSFPPSEALTALRMQANDLRRALPDPALLRDDGNGYALDAEISVDLWEIDSYLRRHRNTTAARRHVDALLYRKLVNYHNAQRHRVARWAWARSVRDLIEGYRRDVGLWLGWGLLAEGRTLEAYGVARDLVGCHPSCSSARGLLETVEYRMANAHLRAAKKAV